MEMKRFKWIKHGCAKFNWRRCSKMTELVAVVAVSVVSEILVMLPSVAVLWWDVDCWRLLVGR